MTTSLCTTICFLALFLIVSCEIPCSYFPLLDLHDFCVRGNQNNRNMYMLNDDVQAQFDNVRCKCICPVEPEGSAKKIDVQVVTVSVAEECSCELVMKRNESDCLRCECKYESRNIMTIEVVIFLVIGVLICLFVYLIALFVMDPAMFRSKLSEPQPEDSFMPQPDSSFPRQQPTSSYLGRVSNAQKRWKSQVQQQRENIFDRQTILS